MKIQRTPYTCGPVSIVNALRVHGKKISERVVRAHTGTTKKDGTTEHGIMNALERLGCSPEFFLETKAMAFDVLHSHVTDGNPVILSVEEGRHWATAIGVVGDRVVVFDSWKAKWNLDENGVWVMDRKRLTKWWIPAEGTERYFGIVVNKPE